MPIDLAELTKSVNGQPEQLVRPEKQVKDQEGAEIKLFKPDFNDDFDEQPEAGILLPSEQMRASLELLEETQERWPQPEFFIYRAKGLFSSFYTHILVGGWKEDAPLEPSVNNLRSLLHPKMRVTDVAHTHTPKVPELQQLKNEVIPVASNCVISPGDIAVALRFGLERLWMVTFGLKYKSLCLVNPKPGINSLSPSAEELLVEYERYLTALPDDQIESAQRLLKQYAYQLGLRLYQSSDMKQFSKF